MKSQDLELIMTIIQTIASIPVIFLLGYKFLQRLLIIPPLKLEIEPSTGFEGIIKKVIPSKRLKYYKGRLIVSEPFYTIDISLTYENRPIRISPCILVKIVKVEKVEPTFNQLNFVPGKAMGGGGCFDYFKLHLTHFSKGVQQAVEFVTNDDEKKFDYFIIQPDEKESFVLWITFEPEYIYTIQIGIEYVYRGRKHQVWGYKKYAFGKSFSIAKQWAFKKYDENTSIYEIIARG